MVSWGLNFNYSMGMSPTVGKAYLASAPALNQ